MSFLKSTDNQIRQQIMNGKLKAASKGACLLALYDPSNASSYTYMAIIKNKQRLLESADYFFKQAYVARKAGEDGTGRNLWKSRLDCGKISEALNLLSEMNMSSNEKMDKFISTIPIAIESGGAKQLFENKYWTNNSREFPTNTIAVLAGIAMKEGLDSDLISLVERLFQAKDTNYFYAAQISAELIANDQFVTNNPIRALKRGLLIEPSQYNLAKKLGIIYEEAEKPTKSVRWGIIGFLLGPDDIHHSIRIGRKCIENGIWRYGIQILTKIHTEFPQDESVLEGLVSLYEKGIAARRDLKQNASELAIQILDKSSCENPRIDDNALTLLRIAEHFDDTWKYWSKVLSKHPSLHVLHHNCGYFYSEAKEFERSLINAKRSAILQPDYPRVWNLIGLVTGHLHQYEDGVKNCRRAILQVQHDSYFMNMGVFYRSQGDFPKSTRAFKQGEALKQKHEKELTYSIAVNKMMLGEIGEGFNKYEARWGIPTFTSPKRIFPQRIWQGPEKMPNVNLLVWLEQGMGDEIMFSPYVNEIKKDVSRLVVECDERLVEIFQRSYEDVEFIPRIMTAEQLPVIETLDYKIPIGHVPQYYVESIKDKLFRLYRDEVRPGTPQPSVLKFDCEKIEKWRSHLGKVFGNKLVCGVSWASRFTNYAREKQYIGLEDLARALGGGGDIGVINLQYSYDPDEADRLKKLGETYGFQFYTPEDIDLKDDLDDVLTILRLCDMSVTPLISLAWMTGAVGTPSYIFRTAPEGRIWQQLGSPILPWYPSMKLFFRHPTEDWAKVSDEISEQMRVHCASAETPRRLSYTEE